MNTSTANTLSVLRDDLALKTGRGISFIGGGVVLWTVFVLLGFVLTDSFVLALAYVFGSGLLFPLSLLLAKPMRVDPYAKGNELGVLAGLLGGVQILFIPLMLGAVFIASQSVPWFLAVLVGAHFLPFSWVYQSRAYLFAAISIPVAAGLVGWLLPTLVPVVVPAVVVVLLVVTVIMLAKANAEDNRSSASAEDDLESMAVGR